MVQRLHKPKFTRKSSFFNSATVYSIKVHHLLQQMMGLTVKGEGRTTDHWGGRQEQYRSLLVALAQKAQLTLVPSFLYKSL